MQRRAASNRNESRTAGTVGTKLTQAVASAFTERVVARAKKGKLRFGNLIAVGAAGLEPNEFWCIGHPDGVLEMTASKNFAAPVWTICEALSADWDDLTEQGYHLCKVVLPIGDGGGDDV